MNKDLNTIRDAWDNRPAAGTNSSGPDGDSLARNDEKVRTLSHKYVEKNADQFKVLETLSEEQCVQAIDILRDQPDNPFRNVLHTTLLPGNDDGADAWFAIQVWLWHKFPPKQIGGTLGAVADLNQILTAAEGNNG